ncbi:diacylglycerol kinase family protein [Patescibacteria group bacterium]|nr:diacylglycerol kinase family protein [Patescibacteria group bacterium]MBU1672960.1 diacylglycerol kinase family protein [Patescibacteria group bacterium]
MFSITRLFRSFKYAGRGFWYILKTEQNFKVFLAFSVIVIVLMIVLKLDAWEMIVLIGLIMLLLVLELLNTIFEKVVDILRPRIHTYVAIIKDMLAAMVLIASVGAAVIGLMIFVPHILALFN